MSTSNFPMSSNQPFKREINVPKDASIKKTVTDTKPRNKPINKNIKFNSPALNKNTDKQAIGESTDSLLNNTSNLSCSNKVKGSSTKNTFNKSNESIQTTLNNNIFSESPIEIVNSSTDKLVKTDAKSAKLNTFDLESNTINAISSKSSEIDTGNAIFSDLTKT